jgi:hypothetical protein
MKPAFGYFCKEPPAGRNGVGARHSSQTRSSIGSGSSAPGGEGKFVFYARPSCVHLFCRQKIDEKALSMKLSTPSFGMFAVSTVLVALIIMSRYFAIDVPILTPIVATHPFEVTLVAWGVMFAAVAFNL